MKVYKIIKTKEEYELALKRFNELFGNFEEGDTEEDELDLLVLLISNYEDNNLPKVEIDLINAIESCMLDTNFTMEEFIEIVGGEIIANMILNRKKDLTIEIVRKLHKRLNIPYDILMKEFVDSTINICENKSNESWKIGDKLMITDRIYGHEFEIGEIVTVSKIDEDFDYECSNGIDSWYVNKNEAGLI